MRFEIKAGGAILILVGLAGLSVVVFALGLFAGYDMARNTAPEAPQAASVYPAPNPPAGSEAAASNSSPNSDDVAASKPQKVTKLKAAATDSGASLSMDKNAGPVEPPASRTIENASASMPPPKIAAPETSGEASDEDSDSSPPDKVASAPPPVPPSAHRGKPFNIQIDAVMDRTGADQMTQRLQKLGYHAFMVPTQMSGQTWWRVRVGPYNSQEEASAAEQELRAKYRDAYAPQ
jgi:cell division septation protein DedD